MLGVIPAIGGKRIDWSLELLLGRAPLGCSGGVLHMAYQRKEMGETKEETQIIISKFNWLAMLQGLLQG